MRFKYGDGLLCLGRIEGKNHSYSHIEDVVHLAMGDASPLLEHTEYGQNLPAALVHLYALAFVKDAGNVLVEAASGDMGDTVDVTLANNV